MKCRSLCMVLIAMNVGVIGCDKPPAPPIKQAAEEEPTTAPTRPTTQELMIGAYKRLPLPNMPLILNVPQSWNVDIGKEFPATFVIGPSPHGQILIRLSQPDANTFRQEQIDERVAAAKKRATENSDQYRKAELLQVGGMMVLEELEFPSPRTMPKVDAKGMGMLDEKGELIMETIRPVEWSLTVFVPADKVFKRHELKVFDLTAEQYEADRALLERVFRSITLDVSAAPAQ